MFSKNLTVVTVAVLLGNVSLVLAQNLLKYCNPRYGFCVNYPNFLQKAQPPENGDGQYFYTADGFNMTASGSNNVLNDSLQTEMKSQRAEIGQITYQNQGKNWYVLSGLKGNQVIYLKTYIGAGSINHLYINYPKKTKSKYDSMTGSIANSFQPGNLNISH